MLVLGRLIHYQCNKTSVRTEQNEGARASVLRQNLVSVRRAKGSVGCSGSGFGCNPSLTCTCSAVQLRCCSSRQQYKAPVLAQLLCWRAGLRWGRSGYGQRTPRTLNYDEQLQLHVSYVSVTSTAPAAISAPARPCYIHRCENELLGPDAPLGRLSLDAQWRLQGARLPQTSVNSMHILAAKHHVSAFACCQSAG